jgi:plasmid stabilization system protein ParE
VNLRIGRRAQQQAVRMAQWWAQHRPGAPKLFTDELERTFRLLVETPGAGVRWPTPRRPRLRRALMPQTGNHVYFQLDEAGRTVHVLAIWGAPRERPPSL